MSSVEDRSAEARMQNIKDNLNAGLPILDWYWGIKDNPLHTGGWLVEAGYGAWEVRAESVAEDKLYHKENIPHYHTFISCKGGVQ